VAFVVSRPQLALAPAQALRPVLSVRPRPRAVAFAAALVVVLGLAYLAARETPLFAVDRVEVRGAPPIVEQDVRSAAGSFVGESLVGLDGDELRRRLESLPSVRSFRYDRAFPHTLRITVVPEKPAAVVRRGPDAWLISERGRVIRAVERRALRRYPRIWHSGGAPLVPGAILQDGATRLALAAVTRLPASFPARVRSTRVGEEAITMILAGGTELRLGGRDALPLKLAVAARILRALPVGERLGLAYLDVSLPERPVGAEKSQVSG
jgi:cell division protein FtsQ